MKRKNVMSKKEKMGSSKSWRKHDRKLKASKLKNHKQC